MIRRNKGSISKVEEAMKTFVAEQSGNEKFCKEVLVGELLWSQTWSYLHIPFSHSFIYFFFSFYLLLSLLDPISYER